MTSTLIYISHVKGLLIRRIDMFIIGFWCYLSLTSSFWLWPLLLGIAGIGLIAAINKLLSSIEELNAEHELAIASLTRLLATTRPGNYRSCDPDGIGIAEVWAQHTFADSKDTPCPEQRFSLIIRTDSPITDAEITLN